MARVELRNISKAFRGRVALDDLSLDIGDGEFFVLLGPTGAGKTTTLRLIAGLDAPDAGSILIGHQDVGTWSAAQRDVALVFQYYSLYPHYTVRQNLEFPLKSKHRRLSAAEIEGRVERAARTLRIEHLLDRKTDRLSGGEMQRVAIGRAIVREPRIFLMDEPLSSLDAKLRELLRAELKDLQMKLGATLLYVTHDQVEAMSMADRMAVLNHGRIVQVGTPHQIYDRPRDTFVATFVGSPAMNLLSGVIRDGRLVVAPGRLEIEMREEARATVGSRPRRRDPRRARRGRRDRPGRRARGPDLRGGASRGRADPHAEGGGTSDQGDGAGAHGHRGRQHGAVHVQPEQGPLLRCADQNPARHGEGAGARWLRFDTSDLESLGQARARRRSRLKGA